MKQSNTDYRDTYYFNQTNPYSRQELETSSIYHEPTINTKINENPYKSNVEIEKSEVVLKPDLSALHLAGGKKHSQGGTPVYLEPDSFVFSDDKTLAFTPKDKKLFEFKEGGKVGAKHNTPSKVLQKNIDMKHYNSLVTILDDPKKDKVAKDSASSMLEKYVQTIGNIAYVQEHKKNFPQGIPDFAQGTAPVYDTDLKDELMEQKQYAKYGGAIENPYKMQSGGFHPLLNNGRIPVPSHKKDRYMGVLPPYPNTFNPYFDKVSHTQYTAPAGLNPSDFYATPGLVDYMNSLNDYKGIDNDLGKADDGQWGWRHQAAYDKFFKNRLTRPIDHFDTVPMGSSPMNLPKPNNPFVTPEDNTPHPNDVTGNAQNGIPVNWEFTPFQKQSQLYNLAKWASVDREMPMRSHYNATYTDPTLLNPEQAIGDMQAGYNRQASQADLYSPIMANAQKAASYGDFLDRVPGVRNQYDNQNVDIINRYGLYNNQNKNEESKINMQNDQQYWQQAAIGRQNFKNMRTNLMDQFMNNRMQDVQDNQSLAYNMLTLGPKPAYGFDFKSGNFYRNDKNILDTTPDSRQDILENYIKQIDFSKLAPSDQIKFLGELSKRDALKYFKPQKKGGIIRNPYKK